MGNRVERGGEIQGGMERERDHV